MESPHATAPFDEGVQSHSFLSANPTPCASGETESARKRATKRPTISALIKAAQAAGLKIAAIKSGDDGVTILIGEKPGGSDISRDDDAEEMRWVESMGVARIGGRVRR